MSVGAPYAIEMFFLDSPCAVTYSAILRERLDPSPSVCRVSAFREEIEQSLETGETMAALVEHAVRTEVSRRRDQSEFVRRGLAAIARSEAAGDWIPAETVIAKLEAKVAAARKRQEKHQQ